MEIKRLGIEIKRLKAGKSTNAVESIPCTWFDIALALLGVAGDTVDLGTDYAREAYQKLVTALVITIGLIACGFVLNVYGYYGANIILASMFAVITAILWWRPQQVAWVGVAGAIIGELDRHDEKHGGLSSGAKWLIDEYASIFKIVALAGTVCLFFLGFVPFGSNPIVFFILIGGCIAASLLADRYKLGGTFAAEFLYWGIFVIVTLSALSLLPQKSWGNEQSFMYALAGNIKGGVVIFTLLVTLIATLSARRAKEALLSKDGKSKGFPWLIFFLVGFLDVMYAPMDHLAKYIPFMSHGPNTTQASVPQAVIKKPSIQTTPQVLHLVPGGNFQKAEITPGAKTIENITWDCPQGCISQIEHDGDQMCETGHSTEYVDGRLWYTGVYQNIKCRVTMLDPAKNRYREQFLEPQGVMIDYRKDLNRVMYNFGTNERLGPIDVIVKTITSQ